MQIKIRGRNTEEMSPVVGFFTDEKGYNIYELENGSRICECGKDSCIYPGEIMQYTGLKDKNGKEIYEGDIVEVGYYELMQIVFQNGKFVPLMGSDDEFCDDRTKEKLNIVGNIYENPELV